MSYEFRKFEDRLYLVFPRLEAAGLFNALTTSSMNFRYIEEDETSLSRIKRHVADVYSDFEISPSELFTGYQAHTANIASIESLTDGVPYRYSRMLEQTDGLVTALSDAALITKFADCTPVLLFDTIRRVHANVHSGWRGTCGHISANALKVMTERFGCAPENILVAIGPTLGADDFEIREDCLCEFRNSFSGIDERVVSRGGGFYTLDLQALIADEMCALGILRENIEIANLSTRYDERFHSYRREGANYGLMSMISMLK